MREAHDRGLVTDEAIAHGIKSTAGIVTTAATVMVAVFAIFATLSQVSLKQLGVGLAAAVLLDATSSPACSLPATMKLLGEWNWYLPRWLNWLPKHSRKPYQPVSEAAYKRALHRIVPGVRPHTPAAINRFDGKGVVVRVGEGAEPLNPRCSLLAVSPWPAPLRSTDCYPLRPGFRYPAHIAGRTSRWAKSEDPCATIGTSGC
jgi:hypothetical protein